jgi:hypothetical protein
MPTDSNIVDLPYSDRQLIIITEGKIVHDQASTKKNNNKIDFANINWQNVDVKNINWKKVGITAGLASLGLSGMVFGPPGVLLTGSVAAVINKLVNAQESGVRILPVGKNAARAIIFPPGHPRDGVVYVGHPAVKTIYYPMAEFHRLCFEHKFCEAIELLMALGATKLRVEHMSGWSKEFSARLSVPLGDPVQMAHLDAHKTSESRHQLLYEASLIGTEHPSVPPHLVWYTHEPTWQSVATGRIKFGLNNFSLIVSYEDDFGINAGLKATVVASGLDAGGRFEDHRSTVWRLVGNFVTASND